jgi:hypothetical protein
MAPPYRVDLVQSVIDGALARSTLRTRCWPAVARCTFPQCPNILPSPYRVSHLHMLVTYHGVPAPDMAPDGPQSSSTLKRPKGREQGHGDQATGRRDPEGDRPPREGEVRPIFPKTPACYGFTIMTNVKPGRAEVVRNYGSKLAKALEADPYLLAPLKLHYLRGCSSITTRGSCTRASSTPTSTSTLRTRSLSS